MSATATAVSAAEKPVRRFPPPCWTQDEALALIQAYRERWYALRRGYLRTADWDAVAEEVGRICPGAIPPKTSAQCRHKMEKLRQRYRAEKQRALSFPGGQFLSTWFYFEAMDSMEKNGNGSNPDEETQSDHDDVLGEDEVWMKKPKDRSMDFKEKLGDRIDRNSGHHYFDSENGSNEFSREKRGIKQDDDSIGQIVSSIKLLADGFVKMEKMKMDMVHEIEKMRMEAEMKRNELLLESQKQIVEAFVKGLAENKKQQQ
ncbi:protein FIP2 isoform X2 [Cynara cardunculus var. scolymus]|uniref:protein FIP2 isoform X2 n=1 Tax=Cynara cardunculus var. scolymus TaxID=59895 RepID=UPI000D624008|nr:protein FIP2 isoform X2 [Cynara cardunculus var. scolymus]